MEMPKSSDADRDRFRALVPDEPGVETKPMFGSLGAFVNGNMFMGLLGSDVGLKLDEADRTALLAEPGAGPFGPSERPMSGWASLPRDWTADQAKPWVGKAHAGSALLPPKQPRARASKKKPR
jgi:TfoX/Sxy family transcriptional regulator of competence genes